MLHCNSSIYLEFMSWVIDSRLILELSASGCERNYWSDACYAASDKVTSVTITPRVSRAQTLVCKYSIQGNGTTSGGAAEVELPGKRWQVPVEVGRLRRWCSKSKGRAPGVRRGKRGTATHIRCRAETYFRHTGRIRKGYSYLYRICHPEWPHA